MPRARVKTATAAKPGLRRKTRKAYFKSRTAVSSQLVTPFCSINWEALVLEFGIFTSPVRESWLKV
jgi:hypothetical protein